MKIIEVVLVDIKWVRQQKPAHIILMGSVASGGSRKGKVFSTLLVFGWKRISIGRFMKTMGLSHESLKQ
jgi:hypothetical protein